jgi:CRISPR-associated protein Cas1
MKRSYYLFNPGRLSRKDNTLVFVAVNSAGGEQPPKYIPVEDVDSLWVYGSLDTNSALFNFLAKHHITVHYFDYYGHYTGSFFPKEYLLAGKVLLSQVSAYQNYERRMNLARTFIIGGAKNMLKNLRYYLNREKDTSEQIQTIEKYLPDIEQSRHIFELMGIEANIRKKYYESFEIIMPELPLQNRAYQPPSNEMNALISFANSLTYAHCLSAIYHTQLNSTISFLHEPGYRRFSLALDLAEIFKPLLADRTIFRTVNKKEIQQSDFEKEINNCTLKEKGRKIFLKAWEERLQQTIEHRSLRKKVSYKRLVILECYKLVKHLVENKPYNPFVIWW